MELKKYGILVVNFLETNYELMFLLLVTILAWLAKLHPLSGITLKQAAGPPKPFLERSSLVPDFYHGDISRALTQHNSKQLVMVLAYAPWDGASRRARVEFERAAQVLNDEISFIAVNCWEPSGECSQKYRTPYYPIMVLFPTGKDRGITYHGPVSAPDIVAWLRRALNPFVVLNSFDELIQTVSVHANVLVSSFNFTQQFHPTCFQQFYWTALRYMEFSKELPHVMFAVTLKPKLYKFYQLGSREPNSTRAVLLSAGYPLLKWKPQHNATSADHLLQWLRLHAHPDRIVELRSSGMKSAKLSTLLSKGPLAVLLSPTNPLLIDSTKLAFRMAALSYSWCGKARTDSLDLLRNAAVLVADNTVLQHKAEKNICELWKSFKQTEAERDTENCCISWTPQISHSQATYANSCSVCTDKAMCPGLPLSSNKIPDRHCRETLSVYPMQQKTSWCCKSIVERRRIKARFLVNKLHNQEDYMQEFFVDQELLAAPVRQLDTLCASHRLAFKQRLPTPSSMPVNTVELTKLVGAGCRENVNRTLKFVLVNGRRFPQLVQNLGAVKSNDRQLLVVDSNAELVHVGGDPFNGTSLVDSLHAFRMSSLPPSRLSDFSNSDVLHCTRRGVCIEEVSSQSFSGQVLQRDQDVLLLYYSPSCVFCRVLSQLFSDLAYFFRAAQGLVFARIDVSKNDLPHTFQVSKVPSLILYQATSRGSDSIPYPLHHRVSLPDLVSFVLRQSGSAVQLASLAPECARGCLRNHTARLRSHLLRLQVKLTRSAELGAWANDRLAELLREYTYWWWKALPRPPPPRSVAADSELQVLRHLVRRTANLHRQYVHRILRTKELLLKLEELLRKGEEVQLSHVIIGDVT